ncbi:SDR family NAD(P)-dependent oxidoreductase [uncultured Methylobacterium sp.]|uniref:SDR family NAD(P)-dependent oxidoreductase n=1 Tax=uncultured Methylobacterium sp. TaxID=157278 RepID=UPI002625450A|nr:SDR family NAD(P)-dependent oxidoreductase [uncultured Methylobacterium sp.]
MARTFGLRGKVALITGAGGGIGAALAADLAGRGARLALVDRDAAGLDAVAAALRSRGADVSAHPLDVTDAAALAALPDAVLVHHGTLDCLVNNAGIALAGRVEDLSLEDVEAVMAVNFTAAMRLTHHCLPILAARPVAQIVAVSSLYGLVAPAGQSAYAASKFALRGFFEALRHEYAGTGLGVTLVHPGGVATGIARNARIGARVDPAAVETGRAAFERHLRLDPAEAARQIARGIEARAPRLVVGKDARQVDRLQRLMPVRYWAILARAIGDV